MAQPQDRKNFPLAGDATDGWSNETDASATCFCGAVQLSIPLKAPGLVDSFVCNCADCHKITASMFASNFVAQDSHVKHLRGREKLSTFTTARTTTTGNSMTNYFCSNCGSLMYRKGSGFPGVSLLRIGSVDDFSLHETVLKPRIEYFAERRANWLHGAEGAKQVEGFNLDN